MGSQFVDLNGDGHLDYLSATFDGSPHLARGSAEGLHQPERLLDADGERILISYFWNYDTRKHEVTARALGGGEVPEERCISALAYDWDRDGDFDLLLGSYENGHLYRQMNEGTDAEPAFTGRNIPVYAGDVPFALPAHMTAPRLVDWDGDGDLDLIAGSFGEHYDHGRSGGVYLSLDEGEEGHPRFGPLHTLIAPSGERGAEPTRPYAGLYADACDWDGDGDLDLVVGGYSLWTPAARPLTDDEQAELEGLREHKAAVEKKLRDYSFAVSRAVTEATGGAKPGTPEYTDAYAAVAAARATERKQILDELADVRAEIDALVPSEQRQGFVWLYERL